MSYELARFISFLDGGVVDSASFNLIYMPSRLRSGSKFGPAGIIGTFELGKFARNKTAQDILWFPILTEGF